MVRKPINKGGDDGKTGDFAEIDVSAIISSGQSALNELHNRFSYRGRVQSVLFQDLLRDCPATGNNRSARGAKGAMNALVTQVFEHSRAGATDDAGIFQSNQEFVLVRQRR